MGVIWKLDTMALCCIPRCSTEKNEIDTNVVQKNVRPTPAAGDGPSDVKHETKHENKVHVTHPLEAVFKVIF